MMEARRVGLIRATESRMKAESAPGLSAAKTLATKLLPAEVAEAAGVAGPSIVPLPWSRY